MKIGVTVTDLDTNPLITSQQTGESICFYQTYETLSNPEIYRTFLKNSISGFRSSKAYTGYKAHLMELGMDRCFVQSNLTTEHCTIEMHHTILTIFDVAMLICEHTLATEGKISSFDLIEKLKEEHYNNMIPLVMLTVTNHELVDTDEFFVHPDVTIGNWVGLLEKYNKGITPAIASKVIRYIDRCEREGCTTDGGLLELRENVEDWSLDY